MQDDFWEKTIEADAEERGVDFPILFHTSGEMGGTRSGDGVLVAEFQASNHPTPY